MNLCLSIFLSNNSSSSFELLFKSSNYAKYYFSNNGLNMRYLLARFYGIIYELSVNIRKYLGNWSWKWISAWSLQRKSDLLQNTSYPGFAKVVWQTSTRLALRPFFYRSNSFQTLVLGVRYKRKMRILV